MKRVRIGELLADKRLLQEFCLSMQNGAVAVLPTDTLYGFGVSASHSQAVARIYQLKNRSEKKPLILFVHDSAELARLGFVVSEPVAASLRRHWPGALTAVLPAPVHPELSAFTWPSMGVRIPDHRELLDLLACLPVKLLTTSANRSGAPSDTDPDKIAAEFAAEIDWLIDGGVLEEGLPSTVADFSVLPPRILRQGKITL